MKLNNFLAVFLAFLLLLTPISSSTEEKQNIVLEELNQTFEEDKAVQPVKIKSVNLEQYLPPKNSAEYKVKKLGNRKYEYVRNADGKQFNSLDEIKKEAKADEQVKLRAGFEERLNLSNEKVRILVSLKINPLEVQKEIQDIKDEYRDEEDTLKGDIRGISLKYAPKTKRQAVEISEKKEIIKISEEDLDRIKDKGRELERVKEQKVREIKDKLSAATENVQNDFLGWVVSNNGEIKRELDGLVSIEIPVGLLEEVLDRPEVDFVDLDEKLAEPELDISNPTLLPGDWWDAGYDGFWVDIAVVDTGIDETHPALETNAEGAVRTFISQDFTSSGTTDDTRGHGTHVAGIIASSDSTYEGIAPGVDTIINAKHLGGVTSDTLAALDWAITNPSAGAEILSNSWGVKYKNPGNSCLPNDAVRPDGDTYYATKYLDAVTDYYDIIAIKSAGNDGECGAISLSTPGDSYNAIVVGAIDDQGTTSRVDDIIASYSSIGPTLDSRKKPDIVAPGTNIKSAAYDWEEGFLGSNPNFVGMSGTSMAAPHVSGAANLLLEYGLSSKGVKSLLINTAEDKGDEGWDVYYGWGELDLNSAYTFRDYVIDDSLKSSYKLYKAEQIVTGEKATLVWNKHNVYTGASTPTTLYDLNDLDLYLYKEIDGSILDFSATFKDNVEQIKSPLEFSNGVIKVEAYTSDFSHGLDTEDYSLATQGGYTLANGPSLAITQQVPENAEDGGFTINCSVANTGDLDAHHVNATLVLPAELNVTSGENPQELGSIINGGTGVATWTVAGELGAHDTYCIYDSESYGEFYNGVTEIYSVTVTDDDTSGPSFANWTFPLTNKTYKMIDVSVDITDGSGISSVILYYDYGNNGSENGNVAMNNVGGDTYSAAIPPAGNVYRNQNVSYYVVAVDNDGDGANDTTNNISEIKLTFLENEAPSITAFEPASTTPEVDEGATLYFNSTPLDLDGDALTFSWLLDLAEQATTETWTYFPNYTHAGIHNITLIISDGIDSASQEWTVTVNNVNQPPMWDFIPENQTIEEEATLRYDVNASDPDGSSIDYFVNDSDVSIDTDGLIIWTAPEDFVGTRNIEITAGDGIDNITTNIVVTVTNINDLPVLSTIPQIIFLEEGFNASLDLDDYITDVDNNISEIVWNYSGNNLIQVAIDSEHVVNFSAPLDYFGSEIITFIANDGQGEANTSVNVTVENVNDPIILEAIGSQTAHEDSLFTVQLSYSDVDGDAGVFSINDSLIAISPEGLISFTPLQTHVGSRTVKIKVGDGEYSDEEEVIFTILNVNDPPVLSEFSDMSANESDLITITPNASDEDGDNLTFNYTAPFNSSGQWQTTFDDAGTYIVTVTADDGNGGTDSEEVTITVYNDLDQDGIPDHNDTDDDNDGLDDMDDHLLGGLNHIATAIPNLNFSINNDTNLTQSFTGIQEVKFLTGNDTLAVFNFDFTAGTLNLGNITINKNEDETTGSLLIKGISLQEGETKTVYIEKLKAVTNSVCILDQEISSVTEISSNCDQANEVKFNCPGTSGGYTCVIDGDKLKISGLQHSGVKEFFIAPPAVGGNSGGGGGGGGGSTTPAPQPTVKSNLIETKAPILDEESTPTITSREGKSSEENLAVKGDTDSSPEQGSSLITGAAVGVFNYQNIKGNPFAIAVIVFFVALLGVFGYWLVHKKIIKKEAHLIRKLIKKKRVILLAFLLLLMFIIFLILSFSPFENNNYDNFASCLTEKNVVFYGSSGNKGTAVQQETFGRSFEKIVFVNCAEDLQRCKDENITKVPSWEAGNEITVGPKSLDELSQFSGCPIM